MRGRRRRTRVACCVADACARETREVSARDRTERRSANGTGSRRAPVEVRAKRYRTDARGGKFVFSQKKHDDVSSRSCPTTGAENEGLDEIVRPGPSLARVGETGGSRARRAGRFRRVGNRRRALGRAAGAIAKKHAPFGAVALRIFCAPRVTRAALVHDAERDAARGEGGDGAKPAIARVRSTQTRPFVRDRAHFYARARSGPARDTNATRGSVRDRGGHAARAERGEVSITICSPSAETSGPGVPASALRCGSRSCGRRRGMLIVATDATARETVWAATPQNRA